jgi:Exonuclease
MDHLCGLTASGFQSVRVCGQINRSAELTLPGNALSRMTGLDLTRDRLLEIACIITDGDLKPVDEGVCFTILTAKDVLQNMNEW